MQRRCSDDATREVGRDIFEILPSRARDWSAVLICEILWTPNGSQPPTVAIVLSPLFLELRDAIRVFVACDRYRVKHRAIVVLRRLARARTQPLIAPNLIFASCESRVCECHEEAMATRKGRGEAEAPDSQATAKRS